MNNLNILIQSFCLLLFLFSSDLYALIVVIKIYIFDKLKKQEEKYFKLVYVFKKFDFLFHFTFHKQMYEICLI